MIADKGKSEQDKNQTA